MKQVLAGLLFLAACVEQGLAQMGVQGYATGDFELLGSLCFLADTNGYIYIDYHSAENQAVTLLVYDETDFDDLFEYSTRSPSGVNPNECQRRKQHARYSKVLDNTNDPHLAVPMTVIQNPKSADARAAHQLFFVMESCGGKPISVDKYSIYAPEAVDCRILRDPEGENDLRAKASGIVIGVLSATIVLMLIPTLIFYFRSRQLASVEL